MRQTDEMVLEFLSYSSATEKDSLLKLFSLERHDPQIRLCMAVLRDTLVSKDMINTQLLRYKRKLLELESRLEKLEEVQNDQY